jgi:hypothetical protein
MIVRVVDHAGSFAENKDVARELRKEFIESAIVGKEEVTIDFTGVELATQSFVHALVADVIRRHGAKVLGTIAFKGCNASLKSLIKVVVEYSQEEMLDGAEGPPRDVVKKKMTRRRKSGAREKRSSQKQTRGRAKAK